MLDTANAKAAPTTSSSGSAFADRPGSAANTTTPPNASRPPPDTGRTAPAEANWMRGMASILSSPIGLNNDGPTAEASMGCSLGEAVEKSVNGGLRCDPCRCCLADHSQPLDETDENSGGT